MLFSTVAYAVDVSETAAMTDYTISAYDTAGSAYGFDINLYNDVLYYLDKKGASVVSFEFPYTEGYISVFRYSTEYRRNDITKIPSAEYDGDGNLVYKVGGKINVFSRALWMYFTNVNGVRKLNIAYLPKTVETTYINWASRAGSSVSVVDDESILYFDSANAPEVTDPLADYEIGVYSKHYNVKYNLYNVVQLLKGEADTNSSAVANTSLTIPPNTTGDVVVYKNGVRYFGRAIFSVKQSSWRFYIEDTKLLVYLTTDDYGADVVNVALAPADDEDIQATYDISLRKVSVSAKIAGCVNQPVNFALVDIENPTELLYINQVVGDEYDRADFDFKFLGDISKCKLIVTFDGQPREISIIENNTEAVPEASIAITDNGNGTATFTLANNDAFYGINKDCRLIVVYYGADNKVINMSVTDSWTHTVTNSIPQGTAKIKCFAWESIKTIVPLVSEQEYLIPEN